MIFFITNSTWTYTDITLLLDSYTKQQQVSITFHVAAYSIRTYQLTMITSRHTSGILFPQSDISFISVWYSCWWRRLLFYYPNHRSSSSSATWEILPLVSLYSSSVNSSSSGIGSYILTNITAATFHSDISIRLYFLGNQSYPSNTRTIVISPQSDNGFISVWYCFWFN